ncbi:acyltransferase domain-containing protein, partial [Streptomyces sp. NPDC056730]|uniref:acyltransferase domain-containing protein n=1 Tax=Streptomyces sp. NPDC056730 TaxID=3345929 RepID=UPI0036741DE3
AAARRAARALLDLIRRGGDWRLRDYARHAAHRGDQAAVRGEPVRIAVVAPSLAALPELLRRAAEGEHDPEAGLHVSDDTATGATATDGEGAGKLAFLFPGQGSQRPGMLAELFVAFPELQRYLQLGARWADALYPPAAFDEETKAGQLARITDTSVAQPALGVVELAAAELLASVGVRPAMAAGHSYGELVALGVAGALAPQDVLTASAARAEAILAQVADGDAGTMAAVTATVEQVEDVLRPAGLAEDVVAANHNAPRQTVISGPTEPMAAAVARLRDAGHPAKPLQVACAFHSPLLAGAGDAFARRLESLTVHPTTFDVWANRTAGTYPAEPAAIRAGLAAQIGAPVRFTEQIEAMYAAGARVFAEVGPGRVLSKLVSAVLGDRPHRTIPLDGGRGAGLSGFLTALARLAVSGADVRAGRLFQGRDAVDPETAVPGRTAGWTVDGQLVRLADGTIPPNALHPARPVTELIVPENHAPHGAAASGPDALVAEFLRTSRDLVAAQRDVMLSYLGGPAAVPADRPPVYATTPQLPAPAALPAPVSATAVVTTAVPAPAVVAPVLDREAVLGAVLAVVAERTGYPVDMIEPDLDLEADLSVDSIKRTEIAGELAVRLGLPVDGGAELDGLSAARTAAGIAGLLTTRLGGGETASGTGDAQAAPAAPTVVSASPAGPAAEVVPPQRLEFTEAELPAVTGTVDSGSTVLLLGGGELAPVVAERLRAAGAEPRLVPTGQLPEAGADAVLY